MVKAPLQILNIHCIILFMEEKKVKYFKEAGNANTAHCLNIVKEEVEETGYRYVIVSSITGETGIAFAEALKDVDVSLMVIAPSDEDAKEEMSEDNRNKILELGATLFKCPSLSFSLDRAFGSKYEESNPSMIIRDTLARFGHGSRVCCENVIAAIDGGLVAEGIEVISVAGTDAGADTVTVIRSASSKRFRDLRVLEILAKPRL